MIGKRYKHVKRGTEYVVVGLGTLQTSSCEELDGKASVIYACEKGGVWVRTQQEFLDGRFIEV